MNKGIDEIPSETMDALVRYSWPEEVERDHILRALDASNWIVGGRNGAAERLGMKQTSLVYRIRKLRISRPASFLPNGAIERHD